MFFLSKKRSFFINLHHINFHQTVVKMKKFTQPACFLYAIIQNILLFYIDQYYIL